MLRLPAAIVMTLKCYWLTCSSGNTEAVRESR